MATKSGVNLKRGLTHLASLKILTMFGVLKLSMRGVCGLSPVAKLLLQHPLVIKESSFVTNAFKSWNPIT